MANQRIGGTGDTLTERPNSPRIDKGEAGDVVTHSYNVNYADAETAIAAAPYAWGDAHAAPYAASFLREIHINKDGPKNALVELVYRPNTPSEAETLPPVGTVTQEADSNGIEIPIGQHTGVTSLNYDEGMSKGKGDWEGIESFVSPQPTYARTEILAAFAFSEANIIAGVATRDTPTDMVSPTANKWLKMGLAVRQAGTAFEKREMWQYAKAGWQTDIYS